MNDGLGQTGSSVLWFVGMNLLVQNHNHYIAAKAIYFGGAGERNRGYALLMTANKPETVLYRAPTFSLLLSSHGGISSWGVCNNYNMQNVYYIIYSL